MPRSKKRRAPAKTTKKTAKKKPSRVRGYAEKVGLAFGPVLLDQVIDNWNNITQGLEGAIQGAQSNPAEVPARSRRRRT